MLPSLPAARIDTRAPVAANFTGTAGPDTIDGTAGDDSINGGTGADTMRGHAGNDSYVVDNSGDKVVENLGEGTDTVRASVTFSLAGQYIERLLLTGTANINGTGNGSSNMLTGNAGNNILDGGAGGDILAGGAGDDLYYVDNSADKVTESANEGADTVRASVTFSIAGQYVERLVLTGTSAINGTGNGLANTITGNAGNNILNGGGGADAMRGLAGDDTYYVDNIGDTVFENANEGTDTVRTSVSFTIVGQYIERIVLTGSAAINATGNGFDNQITGNSGANILDGGTGADKLIGDKGNDVYIIDNVGDTLIERDGEGTDTVRASISFNLTGQFVENLVLTGTAAINGTGNGLANSITGNTGANVLNGGGGIDKLYGGAGNDTYLIDASDQIFENAGEGTDTVQIGATYSLAAVANVENLTLTGSGAFNATGNSLANVLTGNAAANVLDGAAGADRLVGGLGDDSYLVDNAGDVIVEAAGQGDDRITASISYLLSANVERLTLTGNAAINGTGNILANVIVGNGAANILDGGAGADTLAGGLGNDVYIVDNAGDQIVEADGAGIDTVQASASFALSTNVERLVLTGNAAINGTGNGLDNSLTGNAAANTLDGGAGADTLIGGAGDDSYVVDSLADVVTEVAGGGTDTVRSAVAYSLAANLENLVLTGAAAINGTGNGAANAITGNTAANTLDGGAGADTLAGGGGDDTYIVDNAGDTIVEAAGQGNDQVNASVSFSLAGFANVEHLTLLGTAANGTGNALVNGISGNAAANILDGGGGADLMEGGAGNDTYIVDDSADDVREQLDGGIDTVRSSASFTLGQHIERLELTGTANIEATGNMLANTLIGNAGNNVLDGKIGADAMAGGLGNDTYYLDNLGDTVTEAAGAGYENIYASVSFVMSDNLEDLYGNGFDAIDLTGNALANNITGNGNDNVIDGKGGSDRLIGGSGRDGFTFTTALGAGNIDEIVDFQVGLDTIVLRGGSAGPFAALATGQQFPVSAFQLGSTATSTETRILYDNATGALRYDADGMGGVDAVRFATLATGLSLSWSDFAVSGAANRAPVITSSGAASVVENSPVSTIVYRIAASDPDGDALTYRLAGTDAGLLTLDASGAVRLVDSANFETRTSYSFSVIARDTYGLETSKGVTLSVTDVVETLGPTPAVAETEPNNSLGAPQVLDRNIMAPSDNPNLPDDSLRSLVINGNIATLGDKDYFSITLKAGELILLDVDNSSGTLDTFLTLYNGSWNELTTNDDRGAPDAGSAPHPEYGHNTDSYIRFRAPADGIYYFSMAAFEDGGTGTYELNVSVGPPATAAQILQEDIDSMQSGYTWGRTALTYSFPSLISQYPAGTEETQSGQFAAFTPVQRAATVQALQHIASVSGLTFSAAATAPSADLRYAMSDAAETAYAYYPTGDEKSGQAWFNRTDYLFPTRGSYAWTSVLHETGHLLGLKHPHESPSLSYGRDSVEYTVMSYRSYPGGSVEGGFENEEFGFPQSLMMLDIAALQHSYGANYGTAAGDTVYRWSQTTGEMSLNGTGQGAPGANRIFLTVWDGGGNDTYDLSNYTSSVKIDLRPGEWTTTTAEQRANLGNGRFAVGQIANALMFEGDPRSLIENAIGGAGADELTANRAANHLTGNGGFDTFYWRSAADVGVGALADTIMDFNLTNERISLAGIDAKSATGVDDRFAFIGTDAFHNVSGELRYQVVGGNAHIYGDLNGDGVADFEIVVNNVTSLESYMFEL